MMQRALWKFLTNSIADAYHHEDFHEFSFSFAYLYVIDTHNHFKFRCIFHQVLQLFSNENQYPRIFDLDTCSSRTNK